MTNKLNKFSVSLGLLDYVNPIFYSITTITILINMYKVMDLPLYIVYMLGAIVSLIFGFTIPTVKVIVGLGKMKFKMPVNLVFYVNSGIFVSGLTLSKYIFNINNIIFFLIIGLALVFLFFVYNKQKKFNTIAVLIGAVGYLLIYSSLIKIGITSNKIIPVIMFCLAICLFIFLCVVGITWNLKDPRVHWVIETCNVLCQGLVAFGTLLVFA